MSAALKTIDKNEKYNELQNKVSIGLDQIKIDYKKSGGKDLKSWYEIKKALYEEILIDLIEAKRANIKIGSLLQYNIENREIAMNPGLKKFYQIKEQLLRALI